MLNKILSNRITHVGLLEKINYFVFAKSLLLNEQLTDHNVSLLVYSMSQNRLFMHSILPVWNASLCNDANYDLTEWQNLLISYITCQHVIPKLKCDWFNQQFTYPSVVGPWSNTEFNLIKLLNSQNHVSALTCTDYCNANGQFIVEFQWA